MPSAPIRYDWGYVALCLILPVIWGIASARAFDWWQARRRPSSPPTPDDSVDMYHI